MKLIFSAKCKKLVPDIDIDNTYYPIIDKNIFESLCPLDKIRAIKMAPWTIKNLDNPPLYVVKELLKSNPIYIKYVNINDLPRKFLLNLINKHPYMIEYIKYPYKDLQIAAIRSNPKTIQKIKNPSTEIQIEFARINTKKNPDSVHWVDYIIKNANPQVLEWIRAFHPKGERLDKYLEARHNIRR